MGCGSSKSAVAPVSQLGPLPVSETSPQDDEPLATVQHGETVERESSIASIGSMKSTKIRQNEVQFVAANESLSTSNIIKVQEANIQSSGVSESSQYSSRESININTRLISASSAQSKASQDSGLGEEYEHVITEESDSSTKEIAGLPLGMEAPNLTIEGEKLKNPSSVGHRKRLPPIQPTKSCASGGRCLTSKRVTFSNDLIDELPDTPSIIKRPCSRGGLAFDIVLDEASPMDRAIRRKPVHLKKLEQKRGAISHEVLDEKQRAAEQRRKEQSLMLLERLRAKQEKDRQVAEALAKFAAMQAEIKSSVTVDKKIETTTEKREAYLKTMRDRLKEKSQKMEEVKAAKKLTQETLGPSVQTASAAN